MGKKNFKSVSWGTSLMVQWLRLYDLNTGGPGWIPGQGTRFHLLQLKIRYYVPQYQKKKKKPHKKQQHWLGSRRTGFGFKCCRLFAVWLWASHLTSLGLSEESVQNVLQHVHFALEYTHTLLVLLAELCRALSPGWAGKRELHLRGKHRQNTQWHKSKQDPLWPTS